MIGPIIKLVTIGAEIFQDERKMHFVKRAEKLEKIRYKVEDSSFYEKDMDEKGRAERELESETLKLYIDFVKEHEK